MTFLLVTSEAVGEGDSELGRKLMKGFLARLVESGEEIHRIGLLNSGVRLTTEGSPVLDSLRTLEGRGSRITSCITCLEHYGLEKKLAIGEPGTMQETVSTLLAADRVIRV